MTPAEHRAEAEHIAKRAQTAPDRQLLLGILHALLSQTPATVADQQEGTTHP